MNDKDTNKMHVRIREEGSSSLKTKLFYSLGDVGCNCVWSFASGFLMLYYTDSVGVSAAFVGTLMLVARLFDGASDIVAGMIIEKTHTRWGKARPWLLAGLPLALSLVLLFNVPEMLGMNGKHIYIYATYIFMAVICYTIVNLAYIAMLPRFSFSSDDRNVVSVIKGIITLIFVMIINMLTVPLLEKFGGSQSQHSWTIVSGIYAVIAFAALILCFLNVKEGVSVSDDNSSVRDNIPIKEGLKILIKNKYFYIAAAVFVLGNFVQGISSIAVYYARDVLGDSSIFGIINLASMIPMLFAMPFIPSLFKKLGKRNGMLMGTILSILSFIPKLIWPANTTIFIVATFFGGLGQVLFSACLFTLASDIVDYCVWKHDVRLEGLITSICSFGMKVGTGIGSAISGWMLAWGGYEAGVAASVSTRKALIVVQSGVPMFVFVGLSILLLLWDLEKQNYKGH